MQEPIRIKPVTDFQEIDVLDIDDQEVDIVWVGQDDFIRLDCTFRYNTMIMGAAPKFIDENNNPVEIHGVTCMGWEYYLQVNDHDSTIRVWEMSDERPEP